MPNLSAFAFDPRPTAPVTLPAPPAGLALDGYREEVRTLNGRRTRVMVHSAKARPALERAAILEADPEASAPGDPALRRARVWRVETNPTLALLPVDLRLAAMDYAAAVEALEGGRGQDFLSSGGGAAGSRPPSLGRLALAETVGRCDAALDRREIVILSSDPVIRHLPRAYRIGMREALRALTVEGLDRRAILRRMGCEMGPSHGLAHCEGRLSQGLIEAATRVAVALGQMPKAVLAGFEDPLAPRRRARVA